MPLPRSTGEPAAAGTTCRPSPRGQRVVCSFVRHAANIKITVPNAHLSLSLQHRALWASDIVRTVPLERRRRARDDVGGDTVRFLSSPLSSSHLKSFFVFSTSTRCGGIAPRDFDGSGRTARTADFCSSAAGCGITNRSILPIRGHSRRPRHARRCVAFEPNSLPSTPARSAPSSKSAVFQNLL